MRRLRCQLGQTAAEYLGVLLAVSVVIAAVVAGPAANVAGHLSDLVGCIGGGKDCRSGAATASNPGASAPARPASAATVRTVNYSKRLPDPTPVPTVQTTPQMPTPGAATPPAPAATTAPPSTAPGVAPTPPPAESGAWPGQAANLPRSGPRYYVPPKNSGGPKRAPTGRGGARGYEDINRNVWVWNPEGSPGAHGGAHWDVQHPNGSHTNVYPDGSIRGADNFPNRQPSADSDTAEIVRDAAAVVAVGGTVWWLAKLLAPLCGPAAPACAVVL